MGSVTINPLNIVSDPIFSLNTLYKKMDIDLIARLIFGFGAIALFVKVKRRTQLPLRTLLSLNHRKNFGSVKLTSLELALAVFVVIVPALLLALSSGLVWL